MAGDINHVVVVGRLTRDPELRHLASGNPVLQLGIAVNGRQRDETGNWIDKPNFFDVKVFGNQAEMLSQHLSKGRRIGVDGRLDWSSWEAQDGTKRSKVEIVAQSVQFLDSRQEGGEPTGNQYVPAGAQATRDDFTSSAADDDIPF
jgi:single-strand DNA-binding protein